MTSYHGSNYSANVLGNTVVAKRVESSLVEGHVNQSADVPYRIFSEARFIRYEDGSGYAGHKVLQRSHFSDDFFASGFIVEGLFDRSQVPVNHNDPRNVRQQFGE